MIYKSCQHHKGFTLIEILVVVAIIALLIAVLLPSLAAAREQTRSAVCGQHLRQIGIAGSAYVNIHKGWLVGSPYTSGNGARSGFPDGQYQSDPNHYPALHLFDWANPLLYVVSAGPPVEFKQRYAAAVGETFSCPANRRIVGPVKHPALKNLIPADARAPSYATSRYFMFLGQATRAKQKEETLFMTKKCLPPDYLPKLDRIKYPQKKAFLADAHVVSSTDGELSNANWGFASQGAWRKLKKDGPFNYRGAFLKDQIWRHRGAINILAFDGHVQRQTEGDSTARNGFGEKARKACWWFPSRTNTENLTSGHSSEPALIVP
ncbi:MAG: type II secretion system protein [Planctomycetota bacterium]|jgi:prepilin-type N-terminal cleavage/methylation domain-containing protein/prepilin-type processing-associated H-X9-DG protein